MTQLSILIVDDASFIRDLVKRTLRQHLPHAKVDEAINGKKAQSKLKKAKFDLILCDWEMPELSGIELLTWLREFEVSSQQSKTPFIMVTSRGDKKNVVEAVQSGVSDYIGKPFTGEHLMNKVVKSLGKKADQNSPKSTPSQEPSNPLLNANQPAGHSKPNHSNDSNLLTGNSASNQLVERNKATSSQPKEARLLGETTIRTATAQATVKIRDLNLQQVLIEVDAKQLKPQILEQVVIDIQLKTGDKKIARINTYVHLVQVIGNTLSDNLLVKLNYVDDDENKMMVLSKYIASVRH